MLRGHFKATVAVIIWKEALIISIKWLVELKMDKN